MEYITRKEIGKRYGFKPTMSQVITERHDFPKRAMKIDRSHVYRLDEVEEFFWKNPPYTFATRERKERDPPHSDTDSPLLRLTQLFYRSISAV